MTLAARRVVSPGTQTVDTRCWPNRSAMIAFGSPTHRRSGRTSGLAWHWSPRSTPPGPASTAVLIPSLRHVVTRRRYRHHADIAPGRLTVASPTGFTGRAALRAAYTVYPGRRQALRSSSCGASLHGVHVEVDGALCQLIPRRVHAQRPIRVPIFLAALLLSLGSNVSRENRAQR